MNDIIFNFRNFPSYQKAIAFSLSMGILISLGTKAIAKEDYIIYPVKQTQLISEFNSFQSEANKAKQSEAKTYIRSMNRAQQAYYVENSKFTNNIKELGAEFKSETENYRYQILRQRHLRQKVIMTAKAKRSGLRSYIGAVFLVKTPQGYSTTLTKICETNRPSKKPPTNIKPPQNLSTEIRCAAGSHSL